MAHRHDRYADPGMRDGIQLCVRHIPLEFDAELLLELFSDYGEVMDVIIPQKAYLQGRDYLFGFVNYFHRSNALSAIDALNGKPPYYLSVEVSRQTSVELLREQTQSTLQHSGEISSGFRRHSSMGYNYMMTVSPTGQRVIQGMQSGELVRRSLPFGDRGSAAVRDLFEGCVEEEDLPAPGQKQMFPCYKCGNLTFRKCVCGGAYYCKEACRLSNWPNHQQDCLKKLESLRDSEAGPISEVLQKTSTGLLDASFAHSCSNSRQGQMENGIRSEQVVDRGHSHKQPRFPTVKKVEGLRNESFGNKNDGRFPGFPLRNDVSVHDKIILNKESCNYQSLNDGVAKADGDGRLNKHKESDDLCNENKWSFDGQSRNYSNQNQKKGFQHRDGDVDRWKASDRSSDLQNDQNNSIQGGGDKRNFTQLGGNGNRNCNHGDAGRNFNSRRNFNQQDGDGRRNFNQQDGDGRRNFNQQDGDGRRNFNQQDGDGRRNFNQQDGDGRRNFNQQDGDGRRSFNQQDGDSRRNFSQRGGDNRRNFNQQDGDKKKFGNVDSQNDSNGRKNFGSNDRKPFSFGTGDKRSNWKGKPSEGMVQKKYESEEAWDKPVEEKVVQTMPQENVEVQSVPQEIVEHNVTTGTVGKKELVPSTCANIQSAVEKVCVVMKDGPKTFFVQRLDDNDALKLICEEVVKCSSLPVVKPEVGLLGAAMFEGEWYRARVLMLSPQLTVQYVDYGNIDVCDPGMLHSLPESIVGFPPMAEKIEFDESPDQCLKLLEGVIISIKRTEKTENGLTKVKLDDGKGAALSTQPAALVGENAAEKEATGSALEDEVTTSTATVGDVLPAASTLGAGNVLHAPTSQGESVSAPIQVVVVMKEGPKTFFVQRLVNTNTLQLICKEVVNSPSLPLVKPEVGLLCAAMFEGEWYRARILMLTPQLAVQYVDFGNIDVGDPAMLHSLPESIVGFPPMAEKIEFVDENPDKYSTLSDGDTIVIKPMGQVVDGLMKVCVDDGEIVASSTQQTSTASLQDTQEITTVSSLAITAPLVPTASQKQCVSYVDQEPQAEVCVSVGSSLHPVGVPTVDSLQSESTSQLANVNTDNVLKGFMKAKIMVTNDFTDYWVTWEHDLETADQIILKIHENITATPLVNPKVGLLCVAKFDGIWFRARITKVSPQVEVHYIDYGNTELCNRNDLHDLPDIVKDFPPMSFRVQLADGTPLEYQNLIPESFLSIKIVGKDEAGLCTVQVEGVTYPDVPAAVADSAVVNSVPSDHISNVQKATSVLPEENTRPEKVSATVKLSNMGLPQNSTSNIPVTVINATKFYEVRVAVALGGNDYWVQRVSRDNELQLVLVEVNEHASKCLKMSPVVGKLCAAQFQSFWYRALIKRVAPELEVHFIDFGNTETITSDILELPESVVGLSPLALRIRLADGTPEKFSNLPADSTISVKPIKKVADNVAIVQVEGVQYAVETEGNSMQEAGSAAGVSRERQFGAGSSKPEPK